MPVVEKPLHALLEARQLVDRALVDALARKERHEADDRAYSERRLLPIDAQLVVIEPVLLIPQAGPAKRVDGVGNRDEVLEEGRRDVFVRAVDRRQLQRDRQHRGAIERHPRRAVCLLQVLTARQWLVAIEDADVVQPEKSAAEEVIAVWILPVHPP